MKKELENLKIGDLREVAKQYSISGYENMSKTDLIDNILLITGHKSPDDKEEDIIYKKSVRQIAYHVMFIALIAISITATLQNVLNSLYFYPKIYDTHSKTDIYGSILMVSSTIWSIYIYRIWIKSGTVHMWLIISSLFSLGWFIYGAINNYDLIKLYNAGLHVSILKAFFITYWIFIALMTLFTITAGIAYLIRL